MNTLRILMIHRIFASYRKPIYDKLAERYDYLLLHGNNDATINQSKTSYSQVIKGFQYTQNPTNVFFHSFFPLLKFKPKVVIHEFAIGMMSLVPMMVFSKLMRSKFILYSHGYNRMTGFNPKESWADKYRIFLMKLADATVIYSNTDKRMLSEYANSQKIFVAQNTLDMTELLNIKKDFERQGQAEIKAKVGFTHKYNLTFIGRLLEDKMPEKVLEVFELLNTVLPNQVGIHFVGGGDLTKLKAIVAEKRWENAVKFYGPVYDERKSGEFLFASDMMIMPGYLGLAVNHAFAFNCPVISFKRTKTGPFHSPEIEYVVEGETGFLIPDLSVEKMAQTVADYLQNEPLQQRMKSIIRHKIESELTTDNMVKGFTDAVSFVLNKTK